MPASKGSSGVDLVPALFSYISPQIVPILPAGGGLIHYSLNLEEIYGELASDSEDVNLTVTFQMFIAGELVDEQVEVVAVRDRKPNMPTLARTFEEKGLGYVQIMIDSDRPFFRKLVTEHVYALIERPDGGVYILNTGRKYADPNIIRQMQHVGRFCLVHPAHYVDQATGIGNSVLIVNPFDGPIVAEIVPSNCKKVKRKILPRHAVMVDLATVIPDGKWTSALYTGNNRYPAWDVRHKHGDQNSINRMDHLEFFRGEPTDVEAPVAKLAKNALRRWRRRMQYGV